MSIEENSSFDAAGNPPENNPEDNSLSFDIDKENAAGFSDQTGKTGSLTEDTDDIAQFGEWPDGAGVSAPSERQEKAVYEKSAEEMPAKETYVTEDLESAAEKLKLEEEIILAAQAVKEGAEEGSKETADPENGSQEVKEETVKNIPVIEYPESTEPSEKAAASETEEIKENTEEKTAEKEEQTEHTAETVSKAAENEVANVSAAALEAPPKKKKRKPIFKNKKQRLLAILFFILGFMLILAGVIMGVFRHLYGLSNYVEDDGSVNYVSVTGEITMDADDESKVIDQVTDTAGTVSEEVRTDANGQEWKKATKPPWQTYMNTAEEVIPEEVANEEDGMYYLLLIGVDKHDETWYGNSDAMVMITINYHTRKIWMTSMMRDTAVNVPGIGVRKLNAAYANGGAQLLIQTIESNFGIRTDNYAMVSFDAMKDVINAIDGIEVRLTQAEVDRLKAKKAKVEKTDVPGVYHLWGKAALYYSRNRADENADFGRTQRHRKILMAIVNKVKSGEAGSLLSLANKILPLVTHNIPREKIARLIIDLPELMNFEIVQMRIPYDGTFRMQGEFLVPDYALTKEMFFDRVVN